ncbi:MAG: hypothetical protein ABIH56_01300 [Candidatus Margulisiibacteriota bacterium]
MTTKLNNNHGGYSYHYSAEQIQAFQKLSVEQRLKWVEEMAKFLYRFRPDQSRKVCEKFRAGEIG